MKKLLNKSLCAILGLSLSLFAVSCSDDSDDSKESPASSPSSVLPNVTNDIAEDKANVAFYLLSNLCDLSKYSSGSIVENEETGEILGGTEDLPADWENMQFTPDFEGYQLDEATPTVWSLGIADEGLSADEAYSQAAEWFFDLIGEMPATNDDTFPSEYTYKSDVYDAKLVLKKSSEENLYATIDVSIPQLKAVTQIRCVPQSVISAVYPENASDIGYYGAGSVVHDIKKDVVWMCVRPAGGLSTKQYSYWISLSSENAMGDPLVGIENKTITANYGMVKKADDPDYQGAKSLTTEWTYAQKCVSLKTAKAAYHTFALLTLGAYNRTGANKFSYPVGDDDNPEYETHTWTPPTFDGVDTWKTRYAELKKHGIDILLLSAHANRTKGQPVQLTNDAESFFEDCDWDDTGFSRFIFAFGSPTTDSLRQKSNNSNQRLASVSYIQPIFVGTTEAGYGVKLKQTINTYFEQADIPKTNLRNQKIKYSATDTFDEQALQNLYNFGLGPNQYGWDEALSIINSEKVVAWNEAQWRYDIRNYSRYMNLNAKKLYFSNVQKNYAKWYCRLPEASMNIIFTTEMRQDEKGGKDPFANNKNWKVIQRFDPNENNNYWATLNKFERRVDGKVVKWVDEVK
ncbi:hypothetical protein [Treponema sp.]|uniref:hypothetical protein n=1 Tax=Treponema sp. TaxID=166 RepID=UPI0025DE7D9C|nr:hypothetical protein [Treponema sp.]MBR4321081.1 hypothetical protein [Treponema sp.]